MIAGAAFGVQTFFSSLYARTANGSVERKHRHIVEKGRALLTHACVSYIFWTTTFDIAVYIINRLPTACLNNQSPFSILFNLDPGYYFLCVFGCLSFPWLCPYTKDKLSPHSKRCVFMGYSKIHKGYKCFDPTFSKFFVSRHVVFD